MTDLETQFIEAMAKHLPPSGAVLRLVDVGGRAATALCVRRPDIDVVLAPAMDSTWDGAPDSVDAVTAYDTALSGEGLAAVLRALRPGGRLIMMDSRGAPDGGLVEWLEAAGYTRILVEPGLETPEIRGVLMRGEKPHTAAHTLERAQQVAATDTAPPAGRYVHLLIQQTPDKPVWRLTPDDVIEWRAAALDGSALAFSSLPKAVAFMQPAVLNGQLVGISKIAKFRREVAAAWPFALRWNPGTDVWNGARLSLLPVDPTTAEAPDE